MNDAPLQIAIDGPVAAGKGDIAHRLSRKLNLIYIYSGAMYRALALACLRSGIPTKDAVRVTGLFKKTSITLCEPDPGGSYAYKVLLNGEDVSDEIGRPEVAMGSSDVGTIAHVRDMMVVRQQALARGKRVVMEGRDIGLRVLPQASLKVYLTASVEERARRRVKQLARQGVHETLEEVLEDLKKRDTQDMTRSAYPLTKLSDAWQLDTTGMSQEDVVTKIIAELKRRNLV